MKTCNNCGSENEDGAKFCFSCGNTFEVVSDNNSQLDFNPNQDNTIQQPNNYTDNQSDDSQYIDNPQVYNNHQNPYQTNYPIRTKNKNMWIAIILDVIGAFIFYFLSGIGQLYLGLFKRGIVLCLIGLGIVLLNAFILIIFNNVIGYLLTLIIGIVFVIYCAYDAYICTNAINDGQPIPLLFGVMDIQ